MVLENFVYSLRKFFPVRSAPRSSMNVDENEKPSAGRSVLLIQHRPEVQQNMAGDSTVRRASIQ